MFSSSSKYQSKDLLQSYFYSKNKQFDESCVVYSNIQITFTHYDNKDNATDYNLDIMFDNVSSFCAYEKDSDNV